MKHLLAVLLIALNLILLVPSVQAYSSNTRTRNIRPRQSEPQIIYVYQTIPNNWYGYSTYNPGYPGCGRSDIIIGWQAWAACNSAYDSKGSPSVSGWYFANDLSPSFVSANGQGNRLEWQGKVFSSANWGDGPCANGYRLPTRGEWETALYYARLNNTSLSAMLNLPNNGGYRGYKDSNSDVRIENRVDTLANYWSSTLSYNGGYYPTLMRIGAVYQNYRMDGTYYGTSSSSYNWQYTDSGLELVWGTSSDIANVRCIRK